MSIKNLASDVLFKLIAGIVLAGAIIISMVYFASALHEFLNQYNNARSLQIICFGLIIILASVGIYFIVRDEKKTKAPAKFEIQDLLSIDIHSLAFKFVEGFIQGTLKPSTNTETEKKSPHNESQF